MHTGTGFANRQMHTGTGSALVCIIFQSVYDAWFQSVLRWTAETTANALKSYNAVMTTTA